MTGEERVFVQALSQHKINKSTIQELKEVLKLAMLKVGIRAQNLPDDDEKRVIIDHILTNYGNHTPLEIRLAFDMAISGKLELDEKDVVCYENFSCLYFSRIMNSYRLWSKEAYRQLQSTNTSGILEDKKGLSKEEMIEWINEWKDMDNINFDMIPVVFYDFLDREKMITIDNKKKWEYAEKAANQIKGILQSELDFNINAESQRKLKEFVDMEKSGFTGNYKSMIINRSKKLAVQDYLNGIL